MLKHPTWAQSFREAIAAIESDPYPAEPEVRPPSVLDPEKYKDCLLRDYGPFQYVYKLDEEADAVTIVAIELTWLQSRMM
jgi:hypothetical protein